MVAQRRLLAAALLVLSGRWNPAVAQVMPPPLRNSVSKIRWSSYVQVRYSAIESAEDLVALRRFKLMVGGNLTPRIQWYAQGLYKDGNNSPTDGQAYFQETWLRFAFRKRVQLVIGQFKPAFGRERFTPDFEIYTMDRSLVTDALTPDGPYIDSFYRDRGVQFDGELGGGFRYAAGVFDGRGANHAFRGVGPMLVSQILNRPLRERPLLGRPLTVQLGLATGFRRGADLPFRCCCELKADDGIEHFRGADRRWGTELSADWGRLAVRSEYMRARLNFADGAGTDFSSSGWYLQGAWNVARRWQVAAKYEEFDPDQRLRNSQDVRQTTLGLNYYLRQNRTKVMVAYVCRREGEKATPNNVFQVQLQMFLH